MNSCNSMNSNLELFFFRSRMYQNQQMIGPTRNHSVEHCCPGFGPGHGEGCRFASPSAPVSVNQNSNPHNASDERITLVVDNTRFVVDPALFAAHPDTMLGR